MTGLYTMLGLGVAALLGWLAKFLLGRSMINAEQRGYVRGVDQQSSIDSGAAAITAAKVETVQAAGQTSAQAAEASAPTSAVSKADVDRWALPPKGDKPS